MDLRDRQRTESEPPPRSWDQLVGKPSGEWIGRPHHYEGRDGLALYSHKMNFTFCYPSS